MILPPLCYRCARRMTVPNHTPRRMGRAANPTSAAIRTTEQIAVHALSAESKSAERNHSIPSFRGVASPTAELPISPMPLGLWWGTVILRAQRYTGEAGS